MVLEVKLRLSVRFIIILQVNLKVTQIHLNSYEITIPSSSSIKNFMALARLQANALNSKTNWFEHLYALKSKE